MSAERILQVVDMVPNKRGPVELQLLEAARQATARGSRFVLRFTGAAPDWYAQAVRAAGADLGTIDRSRGIEAVIEVCRQERPQVVNFHFGSPAGLAPVARAGPKVVRTEHSFRYPRSLEGPRSVVRHWRARPIARFVAVSEYIARQTMQGYLIPRSRIRVVLNGTDVERFAPQPERKAALRRELLGLSDEHVVITLAALLAAPKRQEMAIRAMPAVTARAPGARLVLAGDGPDRARLLGLIDELALGDVVQLLSGDNDVAAIYAASDIAVQPTMGEGMSGSAIEAQASGLPLVATPNGGIVEAYEEGVSGLSVHDQTPSGLAEGLLELVCDEPRRASMSAAARLRALERFGIQRAARELLAVYDELV